AVGADGARKAEVDAPGEAPAERDALKEEVRVRLVGDVDLDGGGRQANAARIVPGAVEVARGHRGVIDAGLVLRTRERRDVLNLGAAAGAGEREAQALPALLPVDVAEGVAFCGFVSGGVGAGARSGATSADLVRAEAGGETDAVGAGGASGGCNSRG